MTREELITELKEIVRFAHCFGSYEEAVGELLITLEEDAGIPITGLLDRSMVAVPSRNAMLAQRIIDAHSEFVAEMEGQLPVGHGTINPPEE